MKKKLFYLLMSLMFVVILFFAVNISLKFYFNKFLYETPNLTNISLEEANQIVKKGEFKVTLMGEGFSEYSEGQIYTQLPRENTPIKKGRSIKVWVSKGENKVILPDLSIYSLNEAKGELERLGLVLKNTSFVNKENTAFNQVITSEPMAGTKVYSNQEVSLLVNIKTTGEMVRVPDLIGLELFEVRRVLRSKNLILGSVSYVEDEELLEGVVIDMSATFGREVPAGTVIDITINR